MHVVGRPLKHRYQHLNVIIRATSRSVAVLEPTDLSTSDESAVADLTSTQNHMIIFSTASHAVTSALFFHVQSSASLYVKSCQDTGAAQKVPHPHPAKLVANRDNEEIEILDQ